MIEWIDGRDGTSSILVECMPDRTQIMVGPLDTDELRRLKLKQVVELLDRRCQEAASGR